MQHLERLLGPLSSQELARVEELAELLPLIRERAPRADASAMFPRENRELLKQSGFTGLAVPEAYGGRGGGLRDLCAATYLLGTACPSTALCFFFHCSVSSRGLLSLRALDAELFEDPSHARQVRAFAEKVLSRMGGEGLWFGNFASESTRSSGQAVSTRATRVEGGWQLDGVKSAGTGTGVADQYLVSAAIGDLEGEVGMGTFFVPADAPGVRAVAAWDAIGLRASASNGLTLEKVFVPEDEALTVPGAFSRMRAVSRGSFVGNEVAGVCCYLGAAQSVSDYVMEWLTCTRFADTGQPIGSSPMHQELVGRISVDLETAYLWLRRQVELESEHPPPLPHMEVIKQWWMCKGTVAESLFQVAVQGMKACGTSNTDNRMPIARGLRDLSMGLVQAFPVERGRLEVARMVVEGGFLPSFGTD